MYQLAIVEDESDAAATLREFILRYGKDRGESFEVTIFTNALDFEATRRQFDLIFMDIQMPGINGMEAAELLRTYDAETPLIFVTNLAQYAVRGYEVNALDFVVKPVKYSDFRMRMDRAMRVIHKNGRRSLTLKSRDGIRVVSFSDIEYVEVRKHSLNFYLMGEAEPFVVYSTLKSFESQVADGPFVRISSSCLVNMNYVKSIHGSDLYMQDGCALRISRSYRRQALNTITNFIGWSI
jgi:DNA-binding LytR/AlgR family response regulator